MFPIAMAQFRQKYVRPSLKLNIEPHENARPSPYREVIAGVISGAIERQLEGLALSTRTVMINVKECNTVTAMVTEEQRGSAPEHSTIEDAATKRVVLNIEIS